MGSPFSRNGSSQPWFTLQDEPVPPATDDEHARPRRGRGLVTPSDPPTQATELTRLPVNPPPGFTGTQFTQIRRQLAGIAATRYGALALGAAMLLLVVLALAALSAGPGSDPSVIRRDQAQIAQLSRERAQALAAAARADAVATTATAALAGWRSIAIRERAAKRTHAQVAKAHSRERGARR
jgi:hypothetical protein